MTALTFTVDPTLPRLAWYAVYDPAADTCVVEAGTLVEHDPSSDPKWVVAGLWSGAFAEGGFHRSEHLFGSGLRLDHDGLHVVPASTSVERCVYARDAKGWQLSNSLVVLLGRMNAQLDPRVDHTLWSESPARGVHAYLRQIPVLHPVVSTVTQVMFESMRLAPNGEQSFFFRDQPTTFASYGDYVGRLEGELRAMWANATDAGRSHPMRAVTTTSRGYDSAAVTALVTTVLPNVVSWSATRSNTRIPALLRGMMTVDVLDDDGRAIARRLGAEPRALEGPLSALPAKLEAWCWASAQTPPELIFHPLLADAAGHDAPTVWFTGHAGDAVWGRRSSLSLMHGHLTRSAQSGSSLIEARLATGVIDCSVPYLFARNMGSIAAISDSPAMKPWQLDNDYDRPIPRRMLEERGVPRSWFGHGKKAVVHDVESPVGDELRGIFFAHGEWNPTLESLYRSTNFTLFYASRLLHFVKLHGDRGKLLSTASRNDKRALARYRDLHAHTFLLCVEYLRRQFVRVAPTATVEAKVRPPVAPRAQVAARARGGSRAATSSVGE
jgi:hypothetical protein